MHPFSLNYLSFLILFFLVLFIVGMLWPKGKK
jgi:hypothetical protein